MQVPENETLSLLLRNQLSPVCFYKGCVFFTLEIATVVSPKLWYTYFYLFTPGNFAEKRVLKLVVPFSGHCLAVKR